MQLFTAVVCADCRDAAFTGHHTNHTLQLQRSETEFIQLSTAGGSVVEWLACRTQAWMGLGSNRSRDAVLGKLFTPIVPLFTKQQNW